MSLPCLWTSDNSIRSQCNLLNTSYSLITFWSAVSECCRLSDQSLFVVIAQPLPRIFNTPCPSVFNPEQQRRRGLAAGAHDQLACCFNRHAVCGSAFYYGALLLVLFYRLFRSRFELFDRHQFLTKCTKSRRQGLQRLMST